MTSGVTLHSSPTILTGSYLYVYGPTTGTYTVTNLGTVAATGNNFPGAIYLKLGGSVTNGSASDTTANVTGYGTNAGVAIVGAPGTVTNWGTIDGGSAQRGVRLYDGGTLVNGSNSDTLAAIRGYGLNNAVGIGGTTIGIPSGGGSGGGGNGIVIANGLNPPPTGTVINYGTIGNAGDKTGVAFGTGAGVATVINGSTADTVAVIMSGTGTTGTGVYIGSPNGGSIQNFATIGNATARSAIYLGTLTGTVSITNGSATDHSAVITAGGTDGSAIYSNGPSNHLDVLNFGTIQATAGAGIDLVHGGTITNGSTADTSAAIEAHGTHTNIYLKYGVSTVVNYGTIGDGSARAGISFGSLGASGTVINGSTADTVALIISGPTGGSDVYFGGANGGDVVNFATIGAAGARAGVDAGTAAGLVTVTNGNPTADTTALITGGASTGNALAGSSTVAALDVMNYGTIAATASAGIAMADGGSIHNGSLLDTSAVIRGTGTHAAIYIHGGMATVANYGTILGAGGGNAVAFQTPAGFGTIVNGSTADTTALITGGATGGNAINTSGPTDRLFISNYGTILGTAAAAIELTDGGTVTNGSTGDTGALIQAPGTHGGVYVQNGVDATVVNFGTIGGSLAGNAVVFGAVAPAGTVINGSTADTTALIASGPSAAAGVSMNNPSNPLAVANYGTITSVQGNGVYLAGGGTVTNGGGGDTAAAIFGNAIHSAISAKKFVTVSNFGTITDPGTLHAVYATAGALITNGSPTDTTALMSAIGDGIDVDGGATTLTNFATIASTGSGSSAVYTFGGAITNGSSTDTSAAISGGSGGVGISVYGAVVGPVTNFGTIVGYTGVAFGTAASLGTVINAGTIASTSGTNGVAINFANAGGVVIADPGAVFIGLVDASGNGGYGVLHLASGASTGTIDGIGYNFQGFGNTNVDAGANWVLGGLNTLSSGTSLTVQGTVSDTTSLAGAGTVELSGGTALLANGLGAPINIDMAGSTVNTVAFQGSPGGTLSNLISGFATGDRIEVSNVTFDGATQNGPALELTENGGTVFTLANVGFAVLATPHFNFGTDSATGFDFVELACFAGGTRLLTASGEVAVEDVRAGMLVPSLAHGRALRVTWVGTRHVDCAAHPRPQDVWPVRIAAHAFGPGAPHRDLLLSPDHAVALPDGRGGTVLVPARYLLNGASIVQERHDRISYYHVELELHGVLLAEGLATESYLDTGNRGAFVDAGWMRQEQESRVVLS